MAKERKLPLRKCSGCGEMKPKIELVRVVRSPEGEISLDLHGKKSGRGAYVCKNPACLKKAQKSKALERAFSMSIAESVYEELSSQLEAEHE